jgi:hypothetical protein
MTTVPPAFRNCCRAEIICDDSGQECALSLSCQVRNRRTGQIINLQKSIDLRPLTEYIRDQLIAYHGDQIAGLGDFLSKAADAAKRVAASKGIQDLYKKVKAVATPVAKAAIKELPGGEATMALATKTYDQVMKARGGDIKALADLKKVATKALSGNPLAAQIMSTAKKLSTAQDVKEGKDPADIAHRTARIEAVLNPLLPSQVRDHRTVTSGSTDYLIGLEYIIGRRARKAKRPTPRGGMAAKALKAKPFHKRLTPAAKRIVAPPPAIANPMMAKLAPHKVAEEIRETEEEIIDEMIDEGYGEEEIVEEISGWREWLYSRPFRSPAQAALQGDIGAGMRMRYLYNNGLNAILSKAR